MTEQPQERRRLSEEEISKVREKLDMYGWYSLSEVAAVGPRMDSVGASSIAGIARHSAKSRVNIRSGADTDAKTLERIAKLCRFYCDAEGFPY